MLYGDAKIDRFPYVPSGRCNWIRHCLIQNPMFGKRILKSLCFYVTEPFAAIREAIMINLPLLSKSSAAQCQPGFAPGISVSHLIIAILGAALMAFSGTTQAGKFTPLEWQQRVEKHSIGELVGQRKHTTWNRDLNRNFIDDQIETRFTTGELVNVVVDFNECVPPRQAEHLLAGFGRITYLSKLVSSVMLDNVRYENLEKLAALPQVALVEWQIPVGLGNDVASRANQSRASVTYSTDTAEDDGSTGAGVTIAVIDTGVDDGHQSFTGKFVAGFDARIFEDTNGNQIDDSCEPAPLGNGVCTDADDEPGDGSTNPPDNNGHGTHVAGIAVGAALAGETCSTADDGSVEDCAGTAPDADLVDIRICDTTCSSVDMAEALDWLGINAQALGVRVATMSVGGTSGSNDDGTSSLAQQLNYLVSTGTFFSVLHHNAPNTGVPAGTQIVDAPQSASYAMTVAGTNDRDTVTRTDDTNYSGFLRGPRTDFNVATPNLLALKPDIAAPGENIFSSQTGTTSNFVSLSGTSMATPNVAGAAAVIIEDRPEIDPGSLKELLKRTADTTQNTAAFAAVDPNWDNDLGSGMLNVWEALDVVEDADVGFPSCTGPPSQAGKPCGLTGQPSWNNVTDLSTATAPAVGVANTLTAQVRNNSPTVSATALVDFGVYIFAAGNNQFFHIGTQEVTIPPGTTQAVNQGWTPAASDHQCMQVSVEYGLDSDFDNNVTQRNLQIAPSVYTMRVENPYMVPARFNIEAKSRREGWRCRVSQEEFEIHPFMECPRKIGIEYHAPPGAQPGEAADCDVAVWATREDIDKTELIGGVTVRTYVPKACRMVGQLVGYRGNPIADARLSFFGLPVRRIDERPRQERMPDDEPIATATSDADGLFTMELQPLLPYDLVVDHKRFGRHQLQIKPTCELGALRISLTEKNIKLASN